jgi:hypothetical protein
VEVTWLLTEKVTLKKNQSFEKRASVAATVAVVNENNDLVFWTFINYPKEEDCQIFPQLTGLSREKLSIGLIHDLRILGRQFIF